MENASKALLMAGGILIAIIIIALLLRTFSTMNQLQMANLSQEEQQKLIAFNEEYTKYLNQYVYGNDVLTLINKKSITGVDVEVDGELPDKADNHFAYNNTTFTYSSDTKYYKCTEIKFNNATGKVNYIKFVQIVV